MQLLHRWAPGQMSKARVDTTYRNRCMERPRQSPPSSGKDSALREPGPQPAAGHSPCPLGKSTIIQSCHRSQRAMVSDIYQAGLRKSDLQSLQELLVSSSVKWGSEHAQIHSVGVK